MNELSRETLEYLRGCGVSKRQIANSNAETRLYHDLGLYGDIAEACVEELNKKHGVDISQFRFETYFPQEFTGGSWAWLVSMVPVAGSFIRRRKEYAPFTLGMIDRAIRVKKLEE